MKDITGQKFNRLTAIKFFERRKTDKSDNYYWIFICDCNKEKTIRVSSVISGHTKSCGCVQKEWAKRHIIKVGQPHYTHKLSSSRFYNIWEGIKSRTTNINSPNYFRYGKRRIKLCKEWHKFENFRNDMYKSYLYHLQRFGEKDTQIDRINNNGNYNKENCRWATKKEQMRNMRLNHYVAYKDQKNCVAKWAEIYNMPTSRLRWRINKGWDFEKAINTPPIDTSRLA